MKIVSLLLIVFFTVNSFGADKDISVTVLKALDEAINNKIKDWQFRIESGVKEEDFLNLPWKNIAGTHYIAEKQVRYRTKVVIPKVFSGTKVSGGKARLYLSISGPADYSATVYIDGKEKLKLPIVDPVTRAHSIPDLLLSENVQPGKSWQVEILVKNRLIYPAQDFPLSNKNTSFGGAVLMMDSVSEMQQKLKAFRINLYAVDKLTVPWQPSTKDKRPFVPERISRSKLNHQKLKKLRAIYLRRLKKVKLEALRSGDTQRVLKDIEVTMAGLKPISRFAKSFTVYLVGNAHIDLAWLWRTRESVQIAANTFRSVFNNMAQHPDLIYAQSQAQAYDWVEREDPILFARIQKAVKQGTWDPVGGMWAEPDCNLIGGESWIRQMVYAQKFFLEKFGKRAWLGWNPDSFGYNWNMPQFYNKGGIKAFITQKISWNHQTRFPYHLFWWQAPDGSRILTYLPTGSYVEKVEPEKMVEHLLNFEHATGFREMLSLIGFGNHGGGPNLPMLQRAKLLMKQPLFPKVKFIRAHDYIKRIMEKDLSDLPVWKSEMYLENHRGTFTSQASTKRYNRSNESLLETAEKAASFASLLGKKYPQDDLERAWKIVLLNQFHDILPGSSITPVYHDTNRSNARAEKMANGVLHSALAYLGARFTPKTFKGGKTFLVFNPLSWERDGLVKIDLPHGETNFSVTEMNGRYVNSIIQYSQDRLDRTLIFSAKKVPALGVKFYRLVKSKNDQTSKVKNRDANIIENEYFKVTVNKETGNVCSIYDQVNNREVLARGQEGNAIELHENLPGFWDAWNIGYTENSWKVNKADSVKLIEDNAIRSVIRVEKSFLGLSKSNWAPTEGFPSSFFTQNIILYKGSAKIDFITHVDWWEDHTLLKVAFPLGVKSSKATYEIPYAAIERSTGRETVWEKARFEVPVHRWADLTADGYGVSLLNNSKYGMDTHNQVMRLTLLTSPMWPDPLCDRGQHTIAYSLYPHAGDWKSANTVKRAVEFNMPLKVQFINPNGNKKDTVFINSLLKVNVDNATITTIKKSEAGEAYIIRFVESEGRKSEIKAEFYRNLASATEVTLLEDDLSSCEVKGRSLFFSIKPFEIKSFKVKFK
jgi:alpha-mannosidase